MGNLDQLVKEIFSKETKSVTGNIVEFKVPEEIPATGLHPDGLLMVSDLESIASLPAPWCFAKYQHVLLEFKMFGDHLYVNEIDRADARRKLFQSNLLPENATKRIHVPLWFVTSHSREWMAEEYELEKVSEGCYKFVEMKPETLLIVANELPIEEELLPFLIARSGKKLVELCKWLLPKHTSWFIRIIKEARMDKAQVEALEKEWDSGPISKELAEQHRYLAEAFARATKLDLELLDKGKVLGREEGEKLGREAGEKRGKKEIMEKRVKKKMQREITEEEKNAIAIKLETLGEDSIFDSLDELEPDAFLSWLLS